MISHRTHREVSLWLKSADILALSNDGNENISSLNTSPLKHFEYIDSRRSILASNQTSIGEILNENKSNLIPAQDVLSVISSVVSLRSNEGMAKTLSDKAFSLVAEYSRKKRSENIINSVAEN